MKKSLKAQYLETRTITDRSGVNEVTTVIQRIVKLLLKEDEQPSEGLRKKYTRSLCRATTNHLNKIDDSGILGRLKAARYEAFPEKENPEDLFVAAACVGHTSLLKRLLKESAKIPRSKYFGGALREASFGGHKDTVLLLLRHGANPNAEKIDLPLIPLLYLFEDSQQTALQAAALAGHEQIVRILLKRKCLVGTSGEYEKAILDAAQGGHSHLMQYLRSKIFGQRMNEPPCLKECILHKASQYGHVQIVHTMLNAGTRVDSLALRNLSPLALAASRGFNEIVQILLARGASPDGPKLAGTTPLCEAVKGGYERVTRTLLRRGADINAGFPSPLFIAASYGHDHIVRLLLEKGALPEQKLISGDEILSIAVSGGCESVVRLLFEYGANAISWTRKDIL